MSICNLHVAVSTAPTNIYLYSVQRLNLELAAFHRSNLLLSECERAELLLYNCLLKLVRSVSSIVAMGSTSGTMEVGTTMDTLCLAHTLLDEHA